MLGESSMFTLVQEDPNNLSLISIQYNDGDLVLSWSPTDPKIIMKQYQNFITQVNTGTAGIYEVAGEAAKNGDAIEVYDGKIGLFSGRTYSRINATPERMESLNRVFGQWYKYAFTLP